MKVATANITFSNNNNHNKNASSSSITRRRSMLRRRRCGISWSVAMIIVTAAVALLFRHNHPSSHVQAFHIPTASSVSSSSSIHTTTSTDTGGTDIIHRSQRLLLPRQQLPRQSLLLLRMLPPSSSDDEWHPNDPAWTTPQLLEGIWSQIAQAKNMVRNETYTVIYPQMEEEFKKPRYLNLLFAHLDACKDVCDHFGITTTLIPYKQKGRVVGFTVQSFRNPKTTLVPSEGENESDIEFEYDPFWDDGTDFAALYDGIDDEDMVPDPYPAIENKIPDNDETIIDITKQWVSSVMSDMGVCPFTQGAEKAGLPLGDVYYAVDRSSGFEDMYERYWKEVTRIEQNPERDISTILLITPEFCMDNLELFESFTNTLTQPLTALGIEDLIQLVFFHPVWSFRDGDARSSPSGQAANYARRSPWPMINLLRTSQVRTAQKGIPTGLVYKQNEKTLSQVGVDKLETMLRLRDWTDTSEYKVNRREIDALKIAQDFQATGQIAAEDTSLRHDSTPAANRVDRRQVEEGNLIKVLLQALEKRLDKGACTLTGPETSATALATDVLINELEDLISTDTSAATFNGSMASTAKATPAEAFPQISATVAASDGSDIPEDIVRARQARIDAARRSVMEDLLGESNSRSISKGNAVDPIEEVLFGRGGIGENNGDDDLFPKGMNPDSFY